MQKIFGSLDNFFFCLTFQRFLKFKNSLKIYLNQKYNFSFNRENWKCFLFNKSIFIATNPYYLEIIKILYYNVKHLTPIKSKSLWIDYNKR